MRGRYGAFHHAWSEQPAAVRLMAQERYAFAAALLSEGEVVLDLGCGAGEGSALLREEGCRVLSMDVDIESACDLLADGTRLPIKAHSLDAVVAFEVIEHMSPVDGLQLLSEIRRALKLDGLVVLSTPNIRYALHADYHLHEYRPWEFYTTMCAIFDNLRPLAQYLNPLDLLLLTLKRRLPDIAYGLTKAGILQLLEAITPASGCVVRPVDGERGLRVMVALARRLPWNWRC